MDINVAENLKQVREEHNLTQEALAECLGIEPLTVYRWEAGRLPVDFKVLVVIAEFYGVPVERFTRDSSDKKKKAASSVSITFLPAQLILSKSISIILVSCSMNTISTMPLT